MGRERQRDGSGMTRAIETLFYDGRCPLCRREVALLRKLADDGLAFQDIHSATAARLPATEALLKSLHLQRADGVMVTGLAANVAVWQHTVFGALWRVLLWPGVRSVAHGCYDRWAQRRYNRLYGCAGTAAES